MGALTNRTYTFRGRPWELEAIESVDFSDLYGRSVIYNVRGTEILRILPAVRKDEFIPDRTRHMYDGLEINRLNNHLHTEKVSLSYDVGLVRIRENHNVVGKIAPRKWFAQMCTDILDRVGRGASIHIVIGKHMGNISLRMLQECARLLNMNNISVNILPDHYSLTENAITLPHFALTLTPDHRYIVGENVRTISPMLALQLDQLEEEHEGSVVWMDNDGMRDLLVGKHKSPIDLIGAYVIWDDVNFSTRDICSVYSLQGTTFLSLPLLPTAHTGFRVNSAPLRDGDVCIYLDPSAAILPNAESNNLNILFTSHYPSHTHQFDYLCPLLTPTESQQIDLFDKLDERISSKFVNLSKKMLKVGNHTLINLLEVLPTLIASRLPHMGKNFTNLFDSPYWRQRPNTYISADSLDDWIDQEELHKVSLPLPEMKIYRRTEDNFELSDYLSDPITRNSRNLAVLG